ncbi:hypothetical protein ACFFNY_15825 [Paenibacillus hodogayensis]|uniref:Uncharacterized protein n=1 Tax=Paenibacillus hodogayensis TaxID=279208 RepID=A0ABV5VXL8_9BACL
MSWRVAAIEGVKSDEMNAAVVQEAEPPLKQFDSISEGKGEYLPSSKKSLGKHSPQVRSL